MKNGKNIIAILIGLLLISTTFGQQENNKDQALRGSGRVNPSTLAMEFDLPLGNYQGRGINVPISLSYSSKVWRAEYINSQSQVNNPGNCISLNSPKFAEHSASGWTTSMATPYIEYTGWNNIYNDEGNQVSGCTDSQTNTNYYNNALVKRINVHLPSGESHELRMDDTPYVYPINGSPIAPNGTFYAVDGSNIKYIEDAANNIYKLQMPDGSFYTFKNTREYYASAGSNVRKAEKFTDRNGNFTTYNQSNGTWNDTLGRTIQIPFGTNSPAQPTVQTYSLPGMTGTYKFHWKKLKNTTAAESGLTDFSQNLKYMADKSSPDPNGPIRTDALFFSGFTTWIHDEGAPIFNPVVLTDIELPNGQIYKFSYDIYGRIDRIEYPTGGKEHFDYDKILPLAPPTSGENISDQMNFGVIKRKVFVGGGSSSFYEWNYGVSVVQPRGYKISVTNPDGTISQRFLHRGGDTAGLYGYENSLAGMAYETRGFDSQGNLVSRSRTHWTKSTFGIGNTNIPADWHPRVTHEENYIYDSTGNGVYATTKFEYEGDLSQRETPVLRKKTLEYNFVAADGNSFSSIQPGDNPDSNPLPIPTPNPPTLARTTELTYLINDQSYAGVQAYYKNQNMVGLVTASVVKDASGNPVSRSEMKYDDAEFSPAFRGNPTTSRVWDNTKGDWDDPSAYISTRAKFDTYGNQYEAIDAKGNTTFTTFDSTHHAFPIQVTTTAPDPSGDNGSDTGFTTTSTFDPITGLPLKTIDANGLETRIEYDWVTLRPLNTKNFYQNNQVGGMVETIYHDEPNNYWVKSRSQIDVNKWAESITYYDGLGRAYKSEEVNSKGNIFVEKEFDADGRVYRVTNPFRSGEAKAWTTNIYDNSSRVIEVVLPDGAKVQTDYGVSVSGIIGTTKQITDQAGKKRKGISDGLGRMVRVIEDPSGQNLSTDYVFDTLGNLRKTIQGEQSRYFTYDSLGRLRFAKQPEQESNTSFNFTDPITNNSSWSVKYEYDDNGNITTTTDARGVSVSGTYDNFNRLKLRNYSDDTPDVSFYYDGKGLPSVPDFAKGKTTRIASSVSETRYTSFDNLGRLLTHEQITDGKTYPTAYQYNLSGAVTSETYPSGRVMTQNLDQDGVLESLWGQKANQTSTKLYLDQISYNSAGNIEKMRLGNGRWETAQYNNRQQIVQIGLGYSNNDKSLLKLDYSYGSNLENNGSLREQKINFAGISNEIKQTYTYDDLNRLKSSTETANAQVAWKQTFSYDRFGNRTLDAANTTTLTQNVSQKIANPLINTADNRLKSDQDNDNVSDYVYDKAGNLTVDAENQRFVFDAENRMKEFFHSTNQTNTPDAVYRYDGEGKRVKKISGNNQVIFVYNSSGQLIAEYANQTAANPQVSYLTADHLGSPRIITGNNGEVISRHDYMAFGADISETLGNVANRTTAQGYNKPDEIRKQYTGYEHDDESGLDFAQARYYNSSHGRFTSIDPLTASANVKDPQTFNRYMYAMNSPYKFTDPLGLISQSTGASWCGTCKTSEDDNGDYAVEYTITQQSQNPPPPPPPSAEQDQNDIINDASNKSDNVKWTSGETVVATGTVELADKMVKTLGDDAAEFENLEQQRLKAYDATFDALTSLSKDGFSTSMMGTSDGKLKVTLKNPDGITFSGSIGSDGATSGASISTNVKVTNALDLVKDYNTLIQKRNDLYTQRKTEFQKQFNDTALKVISSNIVLNLRSIKINKSQLKAKANRQYLGDLYSSRIRKIAGQ